MELGPYLLRLALLLPLVCGFVVAALWLARRLPAFGAQSMRGQRLQLGETLFLGPGARLTIVRFGGRELLIGVHRSGIRLLASDRTAPAAPPVILRNET